MFVRTDLLAVGFSALAWMPHSYGLVCFDARPSLVPDGLIPALQRRVEQINAAGGELFENLRHGETVRIEAGPFEGYEAIFDARLPGSERVRVLLRLMSRQQVPLVLPAGQVRPVKSQPRRGR